VPDVILNSNSKYDTSWERLNKWLEVQKAWAAKIAAKKQNPNF